MSNVKSTVSTGGKVLGAGSAEHVVSQNDGVDALLASVPIAQDSLALMTVSTVVYEDKHKIPVGAADYNPTGDGTTVASLTLLTVPVVPGTVVIDDGQLALTNIVGGAVGWDDIGTYSANFSSLDPGSVTMYHNTSAPLEVSNGSYNPTGDGTAVASFTITTPMQAPVGLTIVDDQAATVSWTDNGDGTLTPNNENTPPVNGVSGTINYVTGAVALTYAGNVSLTAVLVSYTDTITRTETWTDNGDGTMTPAGDAVNPGVSGTINYALGTAGFTYTMGGTTVPTATADYDYFAQADVRWTDAGDGTLTPSSPYGTPPVSAVSSTIDYLTGTVNLTYSAAVDLDASNTSFSAFEDGTGLASYVHVVRAVNIAGTVTLSSATVVHSIESASQYGVVFGVSGSNMTVTAQGPLSAYNKWKTRIDTVSVDFTGV